MKRFLLLCASIICVVMTLVSCNQKQPEEVLYSSFYTLLKQSPVDEARYKQLYNDGHRIVFKTNNMLAGTTLARTTINYVDPILIEVDYMEIQKRHDNLVPVISHELAHAWEAHYQYGLQEFFKIVNEQKNEQHIPWQDRTFEKSAIAKENETRKYLLSHYPKDYVGMSPTRSL